MHLLINVGNRYDVMWSSFTVITRDDRMDSHGIDVAMVMIITGIISGLWISIHWPDWNYKWVNQINYRSEELLLSHLSYYFKISSPVDIVRQRQENMLVVLNDLFKTSITDAEQALFNSIFRRPKESRSSDAITIQDIKNIVLFLLKSERLNPKFIDFFHTETVDTFLNDLITYFEYFLKLLEFVVVRRDEMHGPERKARNSDSDRVEQMLSEYMAQYRILLGRSYSKILLGEGDVATFHHMANKMHKSYSEQDRHLTELFFACCKQIVWIAMHRRAFDEIDYEFDRLFRSADFQLNKNRTKICKSLTRFEERLLYGQLQENVPVFQRKSPLVLQLTRIQSSQFKYLMVGDNKYEGNDSRMHKLEYENVMADAQLYMADVQHGILGHPKALYDTLLNLDWTAVRKQQYTKDYDPYRLIGQPFLMIPDWNGFSAVHEEKPAVLKFISNKFDVALAKRQRCIWKQKAKYMSKIDKYGLPRDVYSEVEKIINESA